MALSKKATKSPPASAGSAKPPAAPRAGAPAAAAPRGVFVEKPHANVYTVMLVVSFIALVVGCLCLCGEMAQYEWDFKAAGAKVPPEPIDNTPPPAMPEAAQPAPPQEAPPATPPPAATPPAAGAPGAAPPPAGAPAPPPM